MYWLKNSWDSVFIFAFVSFIFPTFWGHLSAPWWQPTEPQPPLCTREALHFHNYANKQNEKIEFSFIWKNCFLWSLDYFLLFCFSGFVFLFQLFCFSGLQPSSKSSSFPVRVENSVPIVPQNQTAQSLQIQPSMLTQVSIFMIFKYVGDLQKLIFSHYHYNLQCFLLDFMCYINTKGLGNKIQDFHIFIEV